MFSRNFIDRFVGRTERALVRGCVSRGDEIARRYYEKRDQSAHVAGARVAEDSKAGEAVAGIYGGLLIFAAVIIGAASLAGEK